MEDTSAPFSITQFKQYEDYLDSKMTPMDLAHLTVSYCFIAVHGDIKRRFNLGSKKNFEFKINSSLSDLNCNYARFHFI